MDSGRQENGAHETSLFRELLRRSIARSRAAQIPLLVSAALVIAAGLARYWQDPSFWLDEAAVALSLQNPTFSSIFAPLERGQMFPRFYLALIAGAREALGYSTLVLRFLPTLAFVAATVAWARLLARRADSLLLGTLAASMLVGAALLLDQSAQLKQYTLDVALALVPFLVADDTIDRWFAGGGGRRAGLILLACAPVLFSYVYPIGLGARLAGWYLVRLRLGRPRLARGPTSAALFCAAALFGLLWYLDVRFNVQDRAVYVEYWREGIMRERLGDGLGSGLRLVGEFLYGWYSGRLFWVLAPVVGLLQGLGVASIATQLWRRPERFAEDRWGSRSVGALVLLGGVVLASLVAGYPIQAGRLTLFTQAFGQVLALEGARFAVTRRGDLLPPLGVWTATLLLLLFGAQRYATFVRSAPPENIRPLLAAMRPEVSDTVWVHTCSVMQAQTLPEPFPLPNVLLGTRRGTPPAGRPVYVLWTHLGDSHCLESLERVRLGATRWEVLYDAHASSLALAEY